MTQAPDEARETRRQRQRLEHEMVPSGTGAEPPAQDGESVEGSQIETTDARTAPDESASTKESPGFNSGVQNVLTDEMTERFMRIMTSHAAKRNAAKVRRESVNCCNLTVEREFCDVDDGSFRSSKARIVAVRASPSVVGLSSFSDGKRIRVCSGCVIASNGSSDTTKILTSATLVRSLSTNNSVIPDIKIKVCLPNAHILDGSISMVDFHYNIVVVEVKSDQKFPEVVLVSDVINRGAVLALGRFYDHGRLMCAQGEIRKQASSFECSELLVSSCHTTMAGVGGPLVKYNGQVVGINFYGENHTPFLSTAVIIRCLDHWKSYGKIIRPWLGLIYTPVDMLPLRVLEKCTYIDKGFYISKVAKGSPADVAGLCVGDVLIECAGKVLSTAPELGALLLDLCNKQMKSYTLESNMTMEVVVRKQLNGREARMTVTADVLSGCSYYSWYDPLPSYIDKMATMRFMEYY
ncbi:putative protease Do-like 14 [Lolium rigidum]|uniref:putative protease Do-like 14 n=1 Tax=Lolium rigidum TaxID=89674 RepID=UPI001F5DAAB4|nr:putative protease Do-like 14 [Lolium rigidum]